MDKKKLLIVDSTEEFCTALEAMLKGDFCIRTVDSGEKALEILDRFTPDVMVLDMMLPGLDGIGVLERFAQRGCKPKVLAIVSMRSDYIFARMTQLEVSYVMMKPCSIAITAERVQEIATAYCEIPMKDRSEEQKLTAVLLELGVNPKHNGYHYIHDCVKSYAEDNTQSLTKELYVAVGASYGVSWQQVERSIRGALEAAWEHRDELVWRKWFPAGTIRALKRPTNGEVICRLAEYLRLEQARKIG